MMMNPGGAPDDSDVDSDGDGAGADHENHLLEQLQALHKQLQDVRTEARANENALSEQFAEKQRKVCTHTKFHTPNTHTK
jgi:hypothetical protein